MLNDFFTVIPHTIYKNFNRVFNLRKTDLNSNNILKKNFANFSKNILI